MTSSEEKEGESLLEKAIAELNRVGIACGSQVSICEADITRPQKGIDVIDVSRIKPENTYQAVHHGDTLFFLTKFENARDKILEAEIAAVTFADEALPKVSSCYLRWAWRARGGFDLRPSPESNRFPVTTYLRSKEGKSAGILTERDEESSNIFFNALVFFACNRREDENKEADESGDSEAVN